MTRANMTPDPRRTINSRCGFSLVEIVVVIVITAILAAVAVPALGTLSTSRSRAAARQLARDLTYARQRALARGVTVWVSISASTDSYTMLDETVGSPGRSGATAMTDPATGRTFSQTFATGEFANVDISAVSIGSGSEVGFDWLGRPKDAGETLISAAGSITLSGGNSISIEPQTGLVTVSP